MTFEFGKRSNDQIKTCHKDLQLIIRESLKVSDVDFGVSEGHRAIERQLELYSQGLSKVDGVRITGKHNENPSLALDIYIYVRGKVKKLAYDQNHLAYVGGVVTSTANRLFLEGKITHKVRWGYNWDKDGEIGTDQRFQDMPHFELYKP